MRGLQPRSQASAPPCPSAAARQGCDRIYVLAEGRVAEEGTHAQLMAGREAAAGGGWSAEADTFLLLRPESASRCTGAVAVYQGSTTRMFPPALGRSPGHLF